MKAVGFARSLPIEYPDSLSDITLPIPDVEKNDLLVNVHAIAANPVDCKVRTLFAPSNGEYRVLGWDAVGEVVATGEAVSEFNIGDKVYYAGDLNRQGCNAEFQLVDHRIAAHAPTSLSNQQAAALPLTSITAWELLFEHLAIPMHAQHLSQLTGSSQSTQSKEYSKENNTILVVGAAGGVGSILIQLIKVLTNAKVVATASREASSDWVKSLGADFVIDHSKPLVPQIESLNVQISHVASLTCTDDYFDSYIELLQPFGKIAIIDDPQSIDVMKMKKKSLSLHIEFMFARSMFKAADIEQQGIILSCIKELVDKGLLKTTLGRFAGVINADNLRKVHAQIESKKTIGKIVLEGFA